MNDLTYILVADGPSDERLVYPINWLLRFLRPELGVTARYVTPLPARERSGGLTGRIRAALDIHTADLLVVHRDAERSEPAQRVKRVAEIAAAATNCDIPHVPVVPVRMTEAWLLCDEAAIRAAAGNPHGREPLNLPRLKQIESCTDPKAALRRALTAARDVSSRRVKRGDINDASILVAEWITDFSPLRALPAFQALEADLAAFLATFRPLP